MINPHRMSLEEYNEWVKKQPVIDPHAERLGIDLNLSMINTAKGLFCDQVKEAGDPVNHPRHYNKGKIEVIDFIEDQELDYHDGSVVKYICRAGVKDPSKLIEDYEKAAWFLKRKIDNLKKRYGK